MNFKLWLLICVLLSLMTGAPAKGQMMLVFKSKVSPDTILVYNTYNPAVSLSMDKKDTSRACPQNETIDWKEAGKLAAPDCDPMDIEVYSSILPVPQMQGYQFFKKNLIYPGDAKVKNVHGIVVVAFRLDAAGYVRDPVVYRPLFPSIDKEAVRLVTAMHRWWANEMDSSYKYRILIRF